MSDRIRYIVNSIEQTLNADREVDSERVNLIPDPSDPDGLNATFFSPGDPIAITLVVTNPAAVGKYNMGDSLVSDLSIVPVVTSITPNTGLPAGGTPVTITGKHFAEGIYLAIGASPLTDIVVVSDTEITAVTGADTLGGSGSPPQDVIASYFADLKAAGLLAGGFTYTT